jgi:hypothetical protein
MNASCTFRFDRSRASINCSGLGDGQADRLLAKDVLAGVDRAQRPRHVQMIG